MNAVPLKTLNYVLKDNFEHRGDWLFLYFFKYHSYHQMQEQDLNLLWKEVKPLCMQVYVCASLGRRI